MAVLSGSILQYETEIIDNLSHHFKHNPRFVLILLGKNGVVDHQLRSGKEIQAPVVITAWNSPTLTLICTNQTTSFTRLVWNRLGKYGFNDICLGEPFYKN